MLSHHNLLFLNTMLPEVNTYNTRIVNLPDVTWRLNWKKKIKSTGVRCVILQYSPAYSLLWIKKLQS